MRSISIIFLALVLPRVFCLSLGLGQRPKTGNSIYVVSAASELKDRCRSVQPGDTVVLKNGTYTDQAFKFTGKGTKKNPITFRAETTGKAILNGNSRLSIDGKYLVVDGLHFIGGALDSGTIVDFAANDGGDSAAQHSVLRNTVVKDYNPTDDETRYSWVTLNGYGNVVEHCRFSGQTHSGVTVCVRLERNQAADHIIRRNYFAGRPLGHGNGFETIRIGTGGKLMTNARCLVTENLFEKCNGEIEIISNKSCENVYSKNNVVVAKALNEKLPSGVRRELHVPESWKSRLHPKILKPANVGPLK